mmetsp:Transcript_11280/g.37346  ORF Transcript_11280/g.37346 Transcript_11280/m.37346 type:complete len:394 (-) Transcript_11280:421-1602(-)
MPERRRRARAARRLGHRRPLRLARRAVHASGVHGPNGVRAGAAALRLARRRRGLLRPQGRGALLARGPRPAQARLRRAGAHARQARAAQRRAVADGGVLLLHLAGPDMPLRLVRYLPARGQGHANAHRGPLPVCNGVGRLCRLAGCGRRVGPHLRRPARAGGVHLLGPAGAGAAGHPHPVQRARPPGRLRLGRLLRLPSSRAARALLARGHAGPPVVVGRRLRQVHSPGGRRGGRAAPRHVAAAGRLAWRLCAHHRYLGRVGARGSAALVHHRTGRHHQRAARDGGRLPADAEGDGQVGRLGGVAGRARHNRAAAPTQEALVGKRLHRPRARVSAPTAPAHLASTHPPESGGNRRRLDRSGLPCPPFFPTLPYVSPPGSRGRRYLCLRARRVV